MVIFLGFGLAAGINVMLRTAREVQARAPDAAGGRDEDEAEPASRPDQTADETDER
jgi:F0F1-type ATP synthase assembly protein I